MLNFETKIWPTLLQGLHVHTRTGYAKYEPLAGIHNDLSKMPIEKYE